MERKKSLLNVIEHYPDINDKQLKSKENKLIKNIKLLNKI
jgi:hypothetical protein